MLSRKSPSIKAFFTTGLLNIPHICFTLSRGYTDYNRRKQPPPRQMEKQTFGSWPGFKILH